MRQTSGLERKPQPRLVHQENYRILWLRLERQKSTSRLRVLTGEEEIQTPRHLPESATHSSLELSPHNHKLYYQRFRATASPRHAMHSATHKAQDKKESAASRLFIKPTQRGEEEEEERSSLSLTTLSLKRN